VDPPGLPFFPAATNVPNGKSHAFLLAIVLVTVGGTSLKGRGVL